MSGEKSASGKPTLSPEESRRIREENYNKTQEFNLFQDAMLEYARENHIPHKGTFELTPRCSMKCRMCYMRLDPPQIKRQGRELTAAQWIDLGRQAFDAGTFDLLLTGGEPMLRPDFAEIYTAMSDMGFLLRVFTNATLVTPKIMDLLRERPPQAMEITLYGASPETYRRIGGIAEGYQRAIDAVEELREFLPSLKLKTTLTRDNAADYPLLKRFAEERALPMEPTAMPLPAVRGAISTAREERMDADELLAFYDANGIDPLGDNPCPDPDKRTSLYCDAGLCTYTVLWNGDMVACILDDDPARPIGRPLEEGFADAWDKLSAFRENKPLPEPCRTCPVFGACGTCAVCHRIESGAYDARSPYACGLYKKAYARRQGEKG